MANTMPTQAIAKARPFPLPSPLPIPLCQLTQNLLSPKDIVEMTSQAENLPTSWVVKGLNVTVECWCNKCPCSTQNCTALLECRQVQTHWIGWVWGVPIVGCHHPGVETIGSIRHVGRHRWRVSCRYIHIGSWSKQRSNYRKHFRHWFVAMEFVRYKSTIYLCAVHPGRNVYLRQIRCGVFCVQLGLGVGSGGQILGKTQECCDDHLQKKE